MYGYNHTKTTFGGTHANYSYCLSNFFGSVTFFKIITKKLSQYPEKWWERIRSKKYSSTNTTTYSLLPFLFS